MTQTITAPTLPPVPVVPTLKVSDLNVYYGESHILRNVDMTIPPKQNGLPDWAQRRGQNHTT